jgi:hypothetical protein
MSGWLTAQFFKTAGRFAAFVLAAAIAGCAQGGAPGGQAQSARHPGSAAAFLATYARPDGRVVRPDQGGDTVSEGQAYGTLARTSRHARGALAGRPWSGVRQAPSAYASLGEPTARATPGSARVWRRVP